MAVVLLRVPIAKIYARCGFFISQFPPIEIIVFDNISYTELKILTYWEIWDFENCQIGQVLG